MDSYVYLHHHLHHHLYLCLYLCLWTAVHTTPVCAHVPLWAHRAAGPTQRAVVRLATPLAEYESLPYAEPPPRTSPAPFAEGATQSPSRAHVADHSEQAARPANLRGAELRWTLSWLRLIASACRPLHWPLPPVVLLLLLLPLPLPLLVVGSSGRES